MGRQSNHTMWADKVPFLSMQTHSGHSHCLPTSSSAPWPIFPRDTAGCLLLTLPTRSYGHTVIPVLQEWQFWSTMSKRYCLPWPFGSLVNHPWAERWRKPGISSAGLSLYHFSSVPSFSLKVLGRLWANPADLVLGKIHAVKMTSSLQTLVRKILLAWVLRQSLIALAN